jgi:hypothetical protein
MAEAETTEIGGQQQQPFLRRGEDYESLYANNVHLQPSEWDLKLTFGELDNDGKSGALFVDQHTSITMSWLQAKLFNYFLTLQLGVYEMAHGKIPIPSSVMPPKPTPPAGEIQDDPGTKQVFEYIAKTREEFFGGTPILP